MTAVRLLDSSGQTVKTFAYGYSDSGDLVRREATGEDPERYLVDDRNPTGRPQVLADLDDSATAVRRAYTYGSGLTEIEEAGTGGSVHRAVHEDRLGSVRLVTDGSGDEATAGRFDYAPYGEPTRGDAAVSPYAFTGQRREDALGLQYHRARWYAPGMANWLSPDPVYDFPNNFGNPYAYCGGDPANAVDPSGTMSLIEVASVGAIVGELTAIDVFSATRILKAQGGEAAQTSDLIVSLLLTVGIVALSFIPVIGFIVAVAQLPQTIDMILVSAHAVIDELGRGNYIKAGLWFALCVLSIIGIVCMIKAIGAGVRVAMEALATQAEVRGLAAAGAAGGESNFAMHAIGEGAEDVGGAAKAVEEGVDAAANFVPKYGAASDPANYPTYAKLTKENGTLERLNKASGAEFREENFLEGHHLVEKKFAPQLKVREDDIIAAPAMAKNHVNRNQVTGINIDRMINKELARLGVTDKSKATMEEIWVAHRNVYESQQVNRRKWAEAIYRKYFQPAGIPYR